MSKDELNSPLAAIERLIKESKNSEETTEWLKELYRSLNARFLSDNNRIWSSAAVFIPFSFAAFAAFVGIKDATWHHALVLGIASTVLLAFWASIADRHRDFQDKAVVWLTAIEEFVGLPRGGTWNAPPIGEKGRSVRELRWALVAIVCLSWLVLILWTGQGGF
jgi:hypothetical protein